MAGALLREVARVRGPSVPGHSGRVLAVPVPSCCVAAVGVTALAHSQRRPPPAKTLSVPRRVFFCFLTQPDLCSWPSPSCPFRPPRAARGSFLLAGERAVCRAGRPLGVPPYLGPFRHRRERLFSSLAVAVLSFPVSAFCFSCPGCLWLFHMVNVLKERLP